MREPDDDRNLTPSEEGSHPAARPEVGEEPGDDVKADLDALTATERQRDEYLELAKRTQADFENYRKRMAAEVQAAATRGKGEVAREVIEAVDNLERALETASASQGADDLAGGVAMVLEGLRGTLARNGVEAIEPRGERFDPQWHEALSTQAVEGAAPGTVVETMQKGYALGEQLIRPARVVVAE